MGNWLSVVEPPPSVVKSPPQLPPPLVSFDESLPPSPVVELPPVDFSPLAARTRMLESSYDLMFGKLALRCLFEDYFEEARRCRTRIVTPGDDPHVDLTFTFSGAFHPEENVLGNAHFRWKSDVVDDPHTFVDLFFSNTKPSFLIRSSLSFPNYGFGAFGIFPIQRRMSSGVMGLRYDSSNVSFGSTIFPFSSGDELPKNAWLVGKMGRLTAGVQYEPIFGNDNGARYKNLSNWSYAIGYEYGSPLSPLFSFGVEFARDSHIIASFYQRMEVRRSCKKRSCKNPREEVEMMVRSIKNPRKEVEMMVRRPIKSPREEFEIVQRRIKKLDEDEIVQRQIKKLDEDEIVGYVDFGVELQTSMDEKGSSNNLDDSSFQLGASWQASKNVLVKGKMGFLSSSLALAFKLGCKSSCILSMLAVRDHTKAETAFGVGICIDNKP